MKELELAIFQIISAVGTARSCYIEAIQEAKSGNFAQADQLMTEGQDAYNEGHVIHANLISKEASGETFPSSLLLMHAEDQTMSAETAKLFAEEFIEVYKKFAEGN